MLKTPGACASFSSSSSKENKRKGFIGDIATTLEVPALNHKQWSSSFIELKNQLKVECATMPTDIRISKAFATLRGLCSSSEEIMSLNAFERKYYDMERRIKVQRKIGHSRSISSESTVDWVIACVLDEKSSAELSDIVDLDHIFGPKKNHKSLLNYDEEEVNETDYHTPHKHQIIYEPRSPRNNDEDYSDEDSSSSTRSDPTVLGPDRGTDRKHTNSHLPISSPDQGEWINTSPSSHNALSHPIPNFNTSLSTHYLSPSALGSPATLRFEAFSPMLSPVRENKTVEESWRDESFYLTPLSRTLKDESNRYKEPTPQLPSPYMKRPPVCLPGSPTRTSEKNFSVSHSQPTSFIPKYRLNNKDNKVLPPTPYSSPGSKGDCLKMPKSRSSSGPTSLRNVSQMDNPKKPKIAPSKSQRSASAGVSALVHPPAKRRYYQGAKTNSGGINEAENGSFRTLANRTPTPTGRIADDKSIEEKHKSLERGSRSSYFSTKTSMTTGSEASVKTITQYSQSIGRQTSLPVAYVQPNRVTRENVFLTPKRVDKLTKSLYYDNFDSSPENPNRISITPSLLSSPERGSNFKSGGRIFEDKPFRREDSATSTIYSVASNSTGDIPNLTLGIFSNSSTRRIPGAPRLIEVTKNASGSTGTVPMKEDGEKRLRIISGSSARSTVYSVSSVDMANEGSLEMRPLVMSESGKETDSPTKRVSPYGKTPNTKNPSRRTPSCGNSPNIRETIREDARRYLDAVQDGFEGMKKEMEPKPPSHDTKTGENSEAMTPRKSSKPQSYTTNNQKSIMKPGQLKNSSTGGQFSGTGNSYSSLGRNHQRVSSAGSEILQRNTSASQIWKGGIENASRVAGERSYMRPLGKDKLRQNGHSPPSRPHSAINLPVLSTKSASHPGGQNTRKAVKKTSIDKSISKTLDIRKQRISQDADKEKLSITAAIGLTNGSRASPNTTVENPKMNPTTSRPVKNIPEIAIGDFDQPRKSAKSGVLADITGIGCGSNPRTTPIGGRNWFGRRSTGTPIISEPIDRIPAHIDIQKENTRPYKGSDQQYLKSNTTQKVKSKSLVNLTGWLNRASPKPIESRIFRKGIKGAKEKSLLQPNGHFSQEEVDNLIKRLSAQIPQTPDEKNGFNALGGRYYTLKIPSLDKSPSKDEKDGNPIAVCMDLINAASNEPQSPRRESLLQISRVMVDAVSKSRDAECAAEEAKMAAGRAEIAFLETRKHLAEMTELMKYRKPEI